jgi:hypothetical protein
VLLDIISSMYIFKWVGRKYQCCSSRIKKRHHCSECACDVIKFPTDTGCR